MKHTRDRVAASLVALLGLVVFTLVSRHSGRSADHGPQAELASGVVRIPHLRPPAKPADRAPEPARTEPAAPDLAAEAAAAERSDAEAELAPIETRIDLLRLVPEQVAGLAAFYTVTGSSGVTVMVRPDGSAERARSEVTGPWTTRLDRSLWPEVVDRAVARFQLGTGCHVRIYFRAAWQEQIQEVARDARRRLPRPPGAGEAVRIHLELDPALTLRAKAVELVQLEEDRS